MPKYAQIDVTTGRCISVSFLSGEVVSDHMILLSDDDNVCLNDTYDVSTAKWTPYQPPAPDPKEAKIAELTTACDNALKTFTSSALGEAHTYLSGTTDMILLNGEYSFVSGPDYDGNPILWYTIESGNVDHTKAQFVQVYLNGRKHVADTKYHLAALMAQVSAATTQADYDAIVWD